MNYEISVPNYISIISNLLWIDWSKVSIVLDLIWQWATVPFIARYRKEQTWNLDEKNIRDILEIQKKEENLYKAKETSIKWILEQWKMTDELFNSILNCLTLKEVEEIYKPYKSKKKTKAMIAIENWFQVVADSVKKNNLSIPSELLLNFSEEEIILWSCEIIWSEISSNISLRHFLIENLNKYWLLSSSKKSEKMLDKLNEKDKSQIVKFDIYSNFSIKISQIKAYQTLALNRWEKLWILTIKLEKDDIIYDKLFNFYLDILWIRTEAIDTLKQWFKIWYDALFSSVENQIRSELNEIAEDQSIETFQNNLSSLLLTKPQYWNTILAIDPWYKAWCKIVVLDNIWNPLFFNKVFLSRKDEWEKILSKIIAEYKIDVVIIWNWTWTNEVQSLVKNIFFWEIYIVNESWASVYSVSDIAEDEFPDLDSLDRWTISIWRRFIDPLSELVKVPVWSIWVWLYQHDMPVKKLEQKLWYVVEDSVNKVWINVNTSSIYLLNYISWIDKRQAKKIYQNRPYSSRNDIKKILSPKAYEQAIWFLRVPESDIIFDNTDIHPDQYDLANYIIENNKTILDDKMIELYPWANQWTIDFILNSYKDAWKDKRVNFAHTKPKWEINLDDISEWDIFEWVVRNVVAFWAFIDIWLKNDWLVHISEMADKFISNPSDVVKVWDSVKVRIISFNKDTWKVQLSMKI